MAEFDIRRVQLPPVFQAFLQPARYKIAWSGRGASKSWTFAAMLLLEGLRRPCRILCARETMDSLDDSVKLMLSDTIDRYGMGDAYTVQNNRIIGPNGTEFLFAGLKHNVSKIKSLEGATHVWVEEAHDVSKNTWETLIPTIRTEGSEIWVSLNPRLDTDDTYKRFILRPPPGAIVLKLSWRDNPWFPEVLRIEKDNLKLTDPEAYEHVWEGATVSTVQGAVYGSELSAATAENRFTTVSLDRTRPVHTFWDLGYGDYTAIWFAQALPGGSYHLIDYMQDCGHTIDWYLIQLQRLAHERGYHYGKDYLPHDGVDAIIHKRLGAGSNKSIDQLMRAAGRKVTIVQKLHVTTGINAARTIFPQCRFDSERCADGIQALRHYQWGPPNPNGITKREPLHNAASHGADAFRTFAVAIKQPEVEVVQDYTNGNYGRSYGSDGWMA